MSRWIINGGNNSFHSLKAPVSTQMKTLLPRALLHVMMYYRNINKLKPLMYHRIHKIVCVLRRFFPSCLIIIESFYILLFHSFYFYLAKFVYIIISDFPNSFTFKNLIDAVIYNLFHCFTSESDAWLCVWHKTSWK